MRRKSIIPLSLAACALVACALVGGAVAPAVASTEPAAAVGKQAIARQLEWTDSYETALSTAKKDGRLVLVDFYTDWCGWCKKLDRDVFAKESFKEAATGVLGVKINATKDRTLAQRYGVNAYPRLFFLDDTGRVIDRVKGYMNLEDFTTRVKQVKNGGSEYERLKTQAGDPSNISAIQRFADFLSETDRLEDSIEYWQQVHDNALQGLFQAPAQRARHEYMHRRSLLRLAEAYSSVGLADVARQHATELQGSYPGSREATDALLLVANLDIKSGNRTEAVQGLNQLVQDQPRSPAARRARALLTQLAQKTN